MKTIIFPSLEERKGALTNYNNAEQAYITSSLALANLMRGKVFGNAALTLKDVGYSGDRMDTAEKHILTMLLPYARFLEKERNFFYNHLWDYVETTLDKKSVHTYLIVKSFSNGLEWYSADSAKYRKNRSLAKLIDHKPLPAVNPYEELHYIEWELSFLLDSARLKEGVNWYRVDVKLGDKNYVLKDEMPNG